MVIVPSVTPSRASAFSSSSIAVTASLRRISASRQTLVWRAARRAGLRNNGSHILRHTFCSHLAMRGASAKAIQELAGHQDLATTQRYMHISPDAVEAAIRLLDAPAPVFERGDMLETADPAFGNVNR
jgi:site-specific recombinase XerD